MPGNVMLDYTSRDYEAIRAQLVGLAQGFLPEWQTVGETNDFGTLLLELFAYMGDVMHFYIDRVSSEAFLGTAVRRQSVLYIADMFGYRPIGQQAASVTLQFTLDLQATAAVTIPFGTIVRTSPKDSSNIVFFETNNDLTLPPSVDGVTASMGTVAATEGFTVYNTTIGASTGIPNAQFMLPDTGIIYRSAQVFTREAGALIDWKEVTHLADAKPTQSVFMVYVDDKNNSFLVFGDNASGRIPPNGADIIVTYRIGVGAKANDLGVGDINDISRSDVTLTGVTVTNIDQPVGGSDPESVDFMRTSIPRAVYIKQRAVTLNDFSDLALQVPGVSEAVAHGDVYTTVYVRIAAVSKTASDANYDKLISDVEAYLSDKIIVGSFVYAEKPQWTDVRTYVVVHVQTKYNQESVREAVYDALNGILVYENVTFGKWITTGDVYRTATTIDGVDWIEVIRNHVGSDVSAPSWPPLPNPPTSQADVDAMTEYVTNVQTDPLTLPRFSAEVLDTDGTTVLVPGGLQVVALGGLG